MGERVDVMAARKIVESIVAAKLAEFKRGKLTGSITLHLSAGRYNGMRVETVHKEGIGCDVLDTVNEGA